MAPREYMCHVEEAKGRKALSAIDEAVRALQQVLDEYEAKEENGESDAGSD
jgi:hypothetical protein